jgi:hypothetical protein
MNNDDHAKWLKAEVQEALDDTSPTVPHDEAMRQIRASLAELKAKYTPAGSSKGQC